VADVRPTVLWVFEPVGEHGCASAVPSNPNSRLGRKRSPLRQGRDDPMAATAKNKTTETYAGIDVSKDTLDVYIHPAGERFKLGRDATGLEALVTRLKACEGLALSVLEATGGFEVTVAAALAGAGLTVAVVNPSRVHHFRKSKGWNAKTDVIDAHAIALFAAAMKPEARPLKDEETEAFSALMGRRRQVIQMLTAEKNRALQTVSSKPMQKSIGRIIAALEAELARIDADIDDKVKASPMWTTKEELLASVPGIGKVIARTLLAEMPELGSLDRRAVAALAGLAPWTRSSGKWRGKSMIGGGREAVRTAIYLGALTASRHNKVLARFGAQLLNNGKSKKVVLIAIARKLLTILNAILRDGTPWQPKNA
jgi:transposase